MWNLRDIVNYSKSMVLREEILDIFCSCAAWYLMPRAPQATATIFLHNAYRDMKIAIKGLVAV
jgi:hypothetical protein